MPSHKERRRFVRFDIDAAVSFLFFDDLHIRTMLEGKIKNLSAGGACVVTHKKIPCGKELEVAFLLPGVRKSLRLRGTVAWVHERSKSDSMAAPAFEAGIRFTEEKESKYFSLLGDYCSRYSKDI